MQFRSEDGKLHGYEDLLAEIFSLRVKAGTLRKQAESAEDQANTMFSGLADLLKIEAVESDVGTLRIVTKAGAKKLDKDKLKEYLVKKGVDSDLVIEAFKKCTKEGKESTYVGFFPVQEKSE